MLNANSASAAKRVPKPGSSRIGSPSSATVPSSRGDRGRQQRHVVLVLEQRERDVPVVELGETGQEEHARDVEPEREREQRLQLVDQARRRRRRARGARGKGKRADGMDALLDEWGRTVSRGRRANLSVAARFARACRWRCTCAARCRDRTSDPPPPRRPAPPARSPPSASAAQQREVAGARRSIDDAPASRRTSRWSWRRVERDVAGRRRSRLVDLPDAQDRKGRDAGTGTTGRASKRWRAIRSAGIAASAASDALRRRRRRPPRGWPRRSPTRAAPRRAGRAASRACG